MAPLVVQFVAWAGFWLAGRLGVVTAAASLGGSLRFAMATMFVFTGLAHFAPRTRSDMIRMVPPVLPAPGLLVSATGVLELAGAAGLGIRSVSSVAAVALAVMLVAMFPANIYAARQQLIIAGRPATPLALRLPMQLFWIGCLLWIAVT
jgi:uncharacterized membrane protein